MGDVTDALVVAGGAGTRLRPLTATTPKPLLPFCGRPFLEGVLARLAAVGVRRVRLVVGADAAPFEVLRPAAADLGLELSTVPEPEPLDTAGGVREVADDLDGPTLVCNGDILTDVDLQRVVDAHRRAGAAATLTLTRVRDTASFGVCVLEGSRIVDFVEKPPPGTLPGQDAINAGTYVLQPEALRRFPRGSLSFERDVFPGLVADGAHVEGVVSDAVWADLGTPERFLDGHRLALDGTLRWPTLPTTAEATGVRVASSARIAPSAQLRGPVLIAEDVEVGAGAVVGPHVVLGAGSQVGQDAEIADTVTFARTGIGDRACVSGSIVGTHARVGAAAVVRDAVLADGAAVAEHAAPEAGVRLAPAVLQPPLRGGPEGRP